VTAATRIVESEGTTVIRERRINAFLQQSRDATVEELRETVFSTGCCESSCEAVENARTYESHGLGARQSPAGNDVGRRGHCWDPLPATVSEDVEDFVLAVVCKV
jgi:hypothetical protein